MSEQRGGGGQEGGGEKGIFSILMVRCNRFPSPGYNRVQTQKGERGREFRNQYYERGKGGRYKEFESPWD